MPFFILDILRYLMRAIALPAHAHVKWFVEEDVITQSSVARYSITEPSVLLWCGIVLAFLITAYVIQRFVHIRFPKWTQWTHVKRPLIIDIAIRILGLWLILTSIQGIVIAPHTHNTWLVIIQACLGILLITGLLRRPAAICLVLFWIASMVFFGIDFLDAFYLIGIAVLTWSPERPRSLYIVSATLGAALVMTAFNEKLLRPDLAVEFLRIHSWNFMPMLGIPYTDRLFILSAGVMEVIFGLLLMLGWVTRLTILGIAPILLLTATLLGPKEVLGHLPIFVIAVLLLIYGNPTYQKK